MPKVVAVSGGFDPIHIGHVRLMQEASQLGDELVVIINNDNWLRHKKGFVFMPETERAELISHFPYVTRVVLTDHPEVITDRSVCSTLRELRPDVFANGGDRGPDGDPVPEVLLCNELGIEMVYNVGSGGKVQSSSWMVDNSLDNKRTFQKPWGKYMNHASGTGWHMKTLHLNPGSRLSLQRHQKREELWVLVEGDATACVGEEVETCEDVPLVPGELMRIPKGHIHRLSSVGGATVVEVMRGEYDEEDIERFVDDYGRA